MRFGDRRAEEDFRSNTIKRRDLAHTWCIHLTGLFFCLWTNTFRHIVSTDGIVYELTTHTKHAIVYALTHTRRRPHTHSHPPSHTLTNDVWHWLLHTEQQPTQGKKRTWKIIYFLDTSWRGGCVLCYYFTMSNKQRKKKKKNRKEGRKRLWKKIHNQNGLWCMRHHHSEALHSPVITPPVECRPWSSTCHLGVHDMLVQTEEIACTTFHTVPRWHFQEGVTPLKGVLKCPERSLTALQHSSFSFFRFRKTIHNNWPRPLIRSKAQWRNEMQNKMLD